MKECSYLKKDRKKSVCFACNIFSMKVKDIFISVFMTEQNILALGLCFYLIINLIDLASFVLHSFVWTWGRAVIFTTEKNWSIKNKSKLTESEFFVVVFLRPVCQVVVLVASLSRQGSVLSFGVVNSFVGMMYNESCERIAVVPDSRLEGWAPVSLRLSGGKPGLVSGEPVQIQMVPSHQAIITPSLMRYNKSIVCFHFTVDSYVPFVC